MLMDEENISGGITNDNIRKWRNISLLYQLVSKGSKMCPYQSDMAEDNV